MFSDKYYKKVTLMPIYKGFSTVNKLQPPYNMTDVELVKIDLLNQFNTRRGERVMMPNFGSIIQDLIYDPLDAISTDQVLQDVKTVIATDPRVKLVGSPTLTEFDSTIRVSVELYFIQQATADHLYLSFKRNNIEI